MTPTDTRLRVLAGYESTFPSQLFQAVLLTGSLAYDNTRKAIERPEVLFICVVRPEDIYTVVKDPFFARLGIRADLPNAFRTLQIDCFWLKCELNGVPCQVGMWTPDFLASFTDLTADIHRVGTTNGAIELVRTTTACGEPYRYMPRASRYGGTVIKQFLLRRDGVHIRNPNYGDLIVAEVLHGKDFGRRITQLIINLNRNYGDQWPRHLIPHVLSHCTRTYRSALLKRIALVGSY